MLPTFLVIGAMKAGTSSLFHYLQNHPQVHMPERKELHFFNRNWHRGWGWYEKQFAGAGNAVAIGEATPNYTKCDEFPLVAERMSQRLPDARLVYVVRHPIERMRSHYQHAYAQGKERAPIERALVENPVYLNTSSYGRQLDHYLNWFARDQIVVVTSEDLMHRRAETVQRVYQFIGVGDTFVTPELQVLAHETARKRDPSPIVLAAKRFPVTRTMAGFAPTLSRRVAESLSPRRMAPSKAIIPDHLRTQLADQLAPDVARLKVLVGADFGGWDLA